MFSVLGTAWRVIIKRAAADWLILSAAAITIFLATTLLATGPIYADAVSLSGVQRTLEDAPVTESNVEITVRTTPGNYADNNERVQEEVPRTFALTGGELTQRAVSESYELPVQRSPDKIDLGVFRYFEGIESRATLIDGNWPSPGEMPFQTAIPDAAAALLELEVGDELVLINRRDRDISVPITIAGIYRVDDPNDPYWFDDTLDTEGFAEGSSFNTFGPFVVDLETLLTEMTPLSTEVNWRVFPDYENLTVSEVSGMRARVQGMESRLNRGRNAGNRYSVETSVIQILRDTERSLLVTRSGVLILTVQLAILAGYALLLTAGLLVESRKVETELLRSRGASSRQVLTMATMEGILLTIPAALLAPWIAALVLRILNDVGPLASINLEIVPVVTRTSYVLALLAALGCIIALAIPAYRSAQSFNQAYVSSGRQRSQNMVQRTGIDLALLVVAAVAFWQLRRYGAPLTSTVQGRLGIDPLLVAAPALGLLAGAILALRSIPLIARIAERSATSRTTAVPALSAWQVARRPLRYARSALLLIMAVAIGLFAASFTTTWKQSQDDQANYAVGADVRVNPNRRFNSSIPELNLENAQLQADGVSLSMPVLRQFGNLSRSSGSGRFVYLDATEAADVVQFRDDLADQPFSALMQELVDRRPSIATIPIPGTPERLALEVTVDIVPLDESVQIPEFIPSRNLEFNPSAQLVVQDAAGLLYRINLGPINASCAEVDEDGQEDTSTAGEQIAQEPNDLSCGRERVEVTLPYTMTNGQVATPEFPLSLVDIEIQAPSPIGIQREATIEISGLHASEEPSGDNWTPITTDLNQDSWQLEYSNLINAFFLPSASYSAEQPENGLKIDILSGAVDGNFPFPVYYSFRPYGTTLPEQIAVIASGHFLALTDTEIGDSIPLSTLSAAAANAEIVGSVTSFPTVDPEREEVFIIDLPTFQMMAFVPGDGIRGATERWVSVSGAAIPDVAATLLADPYSSQRVVDRIDQADTLKSDPVALGAIGSLSMGFVAAAIFAALGFAVSAAVSARERLTEFALLRALGLSSRQLAGWLSLEHGILVLISLVFGTFIGLVLAWIVLPLISITQQARTIVPSVIVIYPWVSILWLELLVIAVLGAVILTLALLLRRMGLGSLLRLGED